MLDVHRKEYERRVRALAALGNRGSATSNELQAADYLCDQLKQMGLQPVREPFLGSRSLGWRMLVHVLIATAGAACFWHLPAISIVIGLIVAVSLWAESATRGAWLSRPWVKHPSQNIIATVSVPRPRLRVILSAHCDTQRCGLIWILFATFGPLFWWVPAFLKPPLTSLWLAMFAQAILGSLAIAFGYNDWLNIANWIVIGCYGVACVLLGQWAMGRFVQGAGDNATGVASVLALGEEWVRQPIEDVELVILFTGCEESGLMGSSEWANKHCRELNDVPTLFLNLDNLGFGPPRFLGMEVPFLGWPNAYPPDMVEAARQTAEQLGLENAGPHAMSGPTDALAFLERGMHGMSIVSFGKWGYMPNYHRLTDTIENLDFDTAWQAVLFGNALIDRITRHQS